MATKEEYTKRGKIKSVYCKNFVTYDECVFEPTVYLNVIVGPNGTGKSTLVSAIVIGFGGDPIVLSRSSNICDYIKNGEFTAVIKLTVYTENDKTKTFTRTFSRDGKSIYKIDCTVMNKTNYLQAIATQNIQINNLCQFLPQDRVQDFAKMNPQELFQSTIKSVCSDKINQEFVQLQELRKLYLYNAKELQANAQKIVEYSVQLEEIKRKLKRFNTRRGFLKQIHVCNVKKIWIEATKIEEEVKEKQTQYEIAVEELKKCEQAYQQFQKKFVSIKKLKDGLIKNVDDKELDATTNLNALNNIIQNIEEIKTMLLKEKSKFQHAKNEVKEYKEDLNNAQRILLAYEQDLENALSGLRTLRENQQSSEEWKLQLEDFKNKILKLVQKVMEINKKLDENYTPEIQMLKSNIARVKNVFQQKCDFIKTTYPNLHSAILWVNENRDKFVGHVYNPMLLELNVANPEHAKYFESIINARDLLAFTCEEKLDMSLLTEELCIKRKLRINIIFSPPSIQCKHKAHMPLEAIRQYGFTAFLIDLISGPASILNYLCSMYHINKVPIGTDYVNQCTSSIPSSIRVYFGGNKRYTVTVSKYTNFSSLMQNFVKSNNLLYSQDINKLNSYEKRLEELLRQSDALKNQRSAIEAEIRDVENQRDNVCTERKKIDRKEIEIANLKRQFNEQKEKVIKIEKTIESLPQVEAVFLAHAEKLVAQIVSMQQTRVEALKNYTNALLEKELAAFKLIVYDRENAELIAELQMKLQQKDEQKAAAEKIQQQLLKAKESYNASQKCALEASENHEPKSANFPNKSLYFEQPNTIEELNDVIDNLKARLECMENIDANIVEDYAARNLEVSNLQKLVEDQEKSQKTVQKTLQEIYTLWSPEVEKVIEAINKHFSDFLQSMSCVGEILLDKCQDHDFDSYGIKIMVQFRKNVPLQVLSRQVQSGGERAVAIALYSLSLQHLTRVPFRCVDEINQGMDPINERKVFEMFVNETTKLGQSQYFFVTPKLLPNLPSNPRMSVHIIFNGMNVTT